MADSVAVFTLGQRQSDDSNTLLSGGSIEFYDAGSTSPKIVYADADLTTPLGSTVYLDSAGYPVTAQNGTQKTLVYTGTEAYKAIGKNAFGQVLFTHDNVKGAPIPGAGVGATGITQDAADVRYTRYANALPSTSTFDDSDVLAIFDSSLPGNAGILGSLFRSDLQARWQANGLIMPVGTRMSFQQATPPAGWVKETSAAFNDATMKFTTGATATTGGTQAFSTVFVLQTPSGTVGSDTPSVTKTASHDHSSRDTGAISPSSTPFAGNLTVAGNTGLTGGGQSHNHSFTGNAIDFRTKYAEFCIGQKS